MRDDESNRMKIFIKDEISFIHVEEQLLQPNIKQKIQDCLEKIHTTVCADLPNAFWNRKQHEVNLPYEPNFSKKQIPTKAQPIQIT